MAHRMMEGMAFQITAFMNWSICTFCIRKIVAILLPKTHLLQSDFDFAPHRLLLTSRKGRDLARAD